MKTNREDEVKKKKKSKVQYTISSMVFDSLEEVECQIEIWKRAGSYNDNSIVFEIGAKYIPVTKFKKIR